MIRRLDRYIVRQFIGLFLGLVMGLPLLFIITDITDHLDDYLDKGLPFAQVAQSYVYQLPLFFFYAFPIAALVATVFTIGNMTRHQEIAAAKAGGISFYRLLAPILLMAVVLSVAALGLSELVPVTNRKRAELLGEHAGYGAELRTNFVFQTEAGHSLAARRLDTDAREMVELVLEKEGRTRGGGVHQVARRATWAPRRGWTLENGYLRVLQPGGKDESFAFASARVLELHETPQDLLAEPKEPEEMRYAEMTRFIRAIERSGGDARKLKVEQAQKISLPLAVLVIVLFGAPLATSSRRGGAAYGIGISLAITMIYLLLFRVGTAVGGSGAMDPLLAAWLPNALFLVAGLALLSRVRT